MICPEFGVNGMERLTHSDGIARHTTNGAKWSFPGANPARMEAGGK